MLNVKAVVAAFNQEKALVGAFSVITNLRMEIFEALVVRREVMTSITMLPPRRWASARTAAATWRWASSSQRSSPRTGSWRRTGAAAPGQSTSRNDSRCVDMWI